MSDEAQTDETATAPRKVKAIQVKRHIDEAQLKKDLAYSLADLDSAMQQQASMLAHYGVLAAKAARQVDDLKLVLENAEAAVYRSGRDAAAKTGDKVTEAQLEKFVARHPQVIAVKKALNEAKQIEAVGKIAIEAFKNRRDMLIQHGAQARAELAGEVRIAARTEREMEAASSRDRILDRQRQRMTDA